MKYKDTNAKASFEEKKLSIMRSASYQLLLGNAWIMLYARKLSKAYSARKFTIGRV